MDNQLQHHGIKGMRWGIRRFQNKDGSLTKLGKKRRDADGGSEKKPEEDYETQKKKALSGGSAKDILKFKGDLTNQELQTAITRLGYEKQLSDMSAKDIKTGTDRLDSMAKKFDSMTNFINKGTNLYNAGSKILNAFTGTDLPTIDGQSKKKLSAAEKAFQKEKDRLLKEGKPEDIVKIFNKLTPDELNAFNKKFTLQDAILKRTKSDDDQPSKKSSDDSTKVKSDNDSKKSSENKSSKVETVEAEIITPTFKRYTESGKKHLEEKIMTPEVRKTSLNDFEITQTDVDDLYTLINSPDFDKYR